MHPTQDLSSDAPTTYDTAVLPDQPQAAPAEASTQPKRGPDAVALVAAIAFCLIAVAGLIGTSLPGWVFGGGLVAVLLVLGGAALLITELRRSRG